MVTGESIRTRSTDPCGKLDLLAFGRGNRAAAADQDARDGALDAAEDAAEDRADAGAGRAMRPVSPLIPSPSIACVTVPRIGYARPLTVT